MMPARTIPGAIDGGDGCSAGAVDHNGVRIHEHWPRAGHGMRGDYLGDWQTHQGARMDAPAWHPQGSTTIHRYEAGGSWHLRTGHTTAPPATPAMRLIFVRLRGIAYRVRFEAMVGDYLRGEHMTMAEVRPLVRGGRALRPGPLRREVEALALTEHLRSY